MDKITHSEVLNANRSFYDRIYNTYKENEYYAYKTPIINDVKKNIEYCVKHLSCYDVFLDIGCGSGFLSNLAKNFFASGIGIDVSEQQVKLYQKEVGIPQYHSMIGDITRLSLRDATVDMVASYSVLHHVLDYYKATDEMTRVLKTGGILYADFEPNMTFHGKIKFFINLRKRIFDKDPSGLDIEKIAEFHHNYTDGIDKDKLLSRLSQNYEILMVGARFPEYSFPQSMITLILKSIYKLTHQKVYPYFWVIAKKK